MKGEMLNTYVPNIAACKRNIKMILQESSDILIQKTEQRKHNVIRFMKARNEVIRTATLERCADSEGSDQPAHMRRLIKALAVRVRFSFSLGYQISN